MVSSNKSNIPDLVTLSFKSVHCKFLLSDPSADVNLLACNDPNKMVDGDKSTIWAREINPYKDTIINLDLNGRYRVSIMCKVVSHWVAIVALKKLQFDPFK